MGKVDITSTVLEKGFDIAKDFLDKLIMPSVEETGLLVKEKVTMWKFNNQVKMLNKAKQICERNKIKTKAINLKLLCPLLENAALEEDDFMQDHWANLLSNLADSKQNIENNVFPYILSQLSIKELSLLIAYKFESHWEAFSNEVFADSVKQVLSTTEQGIASAANVEMANKDDPTNSHLEALKLKQSAFSDLSRLKIEFSNRFEKFEIANIIRLGIIRIDRGQGHHTSGNRLFSETVYVRVTKPHQVVTDNYVFTDLGHIFINAILDMKHQSTQ